MTRFVSSIIMYTDCGSRFLSNLAVLLLRLNMVVGPNGTGKVRPAMFFFVIRATFGIRFSRVLVPTFSLQFYVLFV